MKTTLLALLLLIPCLSWGDIFYMSCMPTKYQISENSEIDYFEPDPENLVNFYVDIKKNVIGRQSSWGYMEYDFTNEQDEFVCGGRDMSTTLTQYVCINRYTLDLRMRESNTIKSSNIVTYKCEHVEKKF